MFVIFPWLVQGALDVRYLTSRYEKGKKWVSDYMQKKQRFLSIPKSNAHADILSWQQGVNGDKLLGPFFCSIGMDSCAFVFSFCSCADSMMRYTIMILDCSLYPGGAVDIDRTSLEQ